MISKIPLIALIGLPNSGKSTLVNKLTGTKVAIESKEAHTTRDLNYGEDFWDGYYLRFVDTGGLVPDPEDKIQSAVQMKSWQAISESDLLIWVIDRKKEPETISQKIIQKVWKTGKPFIICINKVDDPNLERDITEFAFLGGDGFVNVSCNTGYGTDKLMTEITLQLEKLGFEQNFETDIDLSFKKPKREKRKDVKLSKDGSYYIIRNDEGVFQSVDEQNLDNELEGKKFKENEEINIKNIVVDLGGVVFQFRYQQMINYLKEHFDLKKDLQYLHESYWSDTFKNWEVFEKLDFWNKLVKGLKIEKETTAKQLRAIFFAFDGINHKNVDFLCAQKLAGKKIFWLSNASKSDILIREKLEFWKIFDGGLDSFECGLSKPDPEIYKRLLNKYNLKPHESFYVDDLKENFHTAMKLGFKSVYYKDGETNLEQEIAQVEDKNFRLPKVLFLGRPNVGKSSLFNAMAQKDLQIVTDIAGTTMSINDTLVEKNVEKIYEFANISKPVPLSKVQVQTGLDPVDASSTKGESDESRRGISVKHLIFDFDGVLGDTFKEVVEARMVTFNEDEETARKVLNDHFSKPRHAIKNHDKESSRPDLNHDFLQKQISLNLEKSKLFEGFIQEIKKIKNSKFAIVSSGFKEVILALLGNYANLFDQVLDIHDSLSKEEKIEMVCKNWGVNEKEVYYFTDTQTDVLELYKYMDKTRVIGCSWGFQGYKALTEVLPKNQILKEFSDIHKLFEKQEIKKITNNNLKHLIFDFDGVLGDTFKEAVETNQTVFEVDEDTAKQTIRSHFSKVSNAFKNDHIESKPTKEKRDNDEFFKLLIINCIQKSTLFEDFLQEISTLENTKLAIVSGGSKDYILPLLGDYAGMFDFILDYQDSLSKEEKVEMVSKKWGINEKEAYYFTDTQADVLELDQYMDKTMVIGCSWGFQGYKALTEVLPKNQILKEFSDIHKLFEKQENKTSKPQLEKVKIKTSKPYILLDSVGIRQAGKRTFGIESFATYRTIQAANEADVICLVVDGSQNLSHQDQVVAGIAKEAKKGIVVIVNKADLVEPKERKKFIDEFEYKFGFLHVEGFIWVSAQKAFERNVDSQEAKFSKIQLSNAPIKEAPKEKKKDKRRGFGNKEMFLNAENNDIADTSQIWEMIDKCLLERSKEIKKEDLRKIFNYIVKRKPPQKLRAEKKAVLYDLIYVKSTPPTFNLLVKDRDSIHWSFTRFLENILRENFGFKNTEIKVKLVEVERKKVLSY